MRIHCFRYGLLAACLLASTVLAAHAEPAGAVLRDGVVVDVPGSVAYVMHPQGGIEALDLEKGTVLWRSAAAERPLALADGLLVAQAPAGGHGELRIVTLDVRRGALTAQAALPMPAGVRAEAAETVDQKFRVTASPSAQGIVLAWDSQELPSLPRRNAARPGIGAKALAAGEEPEIRSGTALFDARAGRLLSMKAKAAANVQALDASRPVMAKTLSAPTAPERLFASADRRHVLASRRVDEYTSPAPYLWTISDAATGAVLGTLRSAVSMTPFAVTGTRLIHVVPISSRHEGSKWIDQPLRLRAVDLATGQELWTREIRDTAFRGPFPL